MAFTAQDVKALREKTGVGMMECKKALVEADGDMDKAIDYLRERGLAAAWRPEEYYVRKAVRLDDAAQKLAFAEYVRLSDDLVDRDGSHACGERL